MREVLERQRQAFLADGGPPHVPQAQAPLIACFLAHR
jgi:hypothetical protein